MREYVCVISRYFEDGTTTVQINTSQRKIKPENKVVHGKEGDMYIDWYDSMKEAVIAVAECQRISKKSYTAAIAERKTIKHKEW